MQKSLINELMSQSIVFYFLIGVVLSFAFYNDSRYIKSSLFATLPLMIYMLGRDNPKTGKDKLWEPISGFVIIGAGLVYLETLVKQPYRFIVWVFIISLVLKKLSEAATIKKVPYDLDNQKHWKSVPHSSYVFNWFVGATSFIVLAAFSFESIYVKWLTYLSWIIITVFLQFEARKQALSFFNLSKVSEKKIKSPGTNIPSNQLFYFYFVFYGLLFLPTLYLLIFSKDAISAGVSGFLFWLTFIIYAFRQSSFQANLTQSE